MTVQQKTKQQVLFYSIEHSTDAICPLQTCSFYLSFSSSCSCNKNGHPTHSNYLIYSSETSSATTWAFHMHLFLKTRFDFASSLNLGHAVNILFCLWWDADLNCKSTGQDEFSCSIKLPADFYRMLFDDARLCQTFNVSSLMSHLTSFWTLHTLPAICRPPMVDLRSALSTTHLSGSLQAHRCQCLNHLRYTCSVFAARSRASCVNCITYLRLIRERRYAMALIIEHV